MLKRLFSSMLKNCSECRLYDRTTKLCKINGVNAIKNRLDDNICGLDSKQFWPLDTTNLIFIDTYALYIFETEKNNDTTK